MAMLHDACKAYASSRKREDYDEMMVAMMIAVTRGDQLLAPGQLGRDEKGELSVQLGMVQASDGQWYYVACTEEAELKKIEGATSVQVPLAELLRRAKTEENVGGIVLDPMSSACFFSKEDASVLLDDLANAHVTDA